MTNSRQPGRAERTFPWTDSPGYARPFELDQLENLLPLTPIMCFLPFRFCPLCQHHIFSGETIFVTPPELPVAVYVCYSCGTSLMVWFGFYTDREAKSISPFGGGARPPLLTRGGHPAEKPPKKNRFSSLLIKQNQTGDSG